MEDDDEFGDLYADVLQPLTAPVQSRLKPQPPFQKNDITKASRPADLVLSSDDDDENVFPALNSNPGAHLNQSIVLSRPGLVIRPDVRGFDLNQDAGNSGGVAGVKIDLKDRVLKNENVILPLEQKALINSSFMDEADIDVLVEEEDDSEDFVVKDENLGGEKIKIIMAGIGNATNVGVGQGDIKTGDFLSDPIIPGISAGGGVQSHGNASIEDESDSDSEDDLQIVLNDTYHGPMVMEKIGGGGAMGVEEDDEEDEDGDPLVIVADNDDPNNQLMIMEDRDWGGEEAGLGGDGDKKEPGDVSKVGGVGGSSMVPKIGYNNHVYHHPFPSQFKYVRPGAAPVPGATSSGGVTPGQVRPPGIMIPVAGRGRGDWRPSGLKVPPGMQKGFHPGYGAQVWANGAAGRGYGSGLEFTLPSHKTIFEVDIDSFEEKPWRVQGMDVADFFNFGMNEESWKDFCKQLEQCRLETTMQSKIRVYESGRTEQDYDPDLPPELAAAAGIQDTSESAKHGLTDDGQSDLAKRAARLRPPPPTGRAIPVEMAYSERLPSVDLRKPRISDLDVVIEIICQNSADDDSYPGNDMSDHPDNDRPMEYLTDCNEFEVLRQGDTVHADSYPNAGSRKKDNPGTRSTSPKPVDDDMPPGDGSLRLSSEARPLDSTGSREGTPVYPDRKFSVSREERREKVSLRRARSPAIHGTKKSTRNKSFNDPQKEESFESADGNRSPASLSPDARADVADESVEHKHNTSDEIVLVEKDFEIVEKQECLNDTSEDDTSKHASTIQKLSSQVEPAFPEEVENGEDSKTGRSSENSQAISGSSKDNWRRHNAVEEVHDGHSMRISSKKLDNRDEVHIRKKVHDERQDIDRRHTAVRGREELYPQKGRDPYTGSHSLTKYERDRRKEIHNSESVWQQRDEDMHVRRSRVEDTRKREHHGESGSRHRSKIQEIESEKEEHQIRKQLENGSWRASYERDIAPKHIASKHREREDNLKSRNDNMDDSHIKRRKEEPYLRRERAEREEMFHAHRETGSHRKRERDDLFDPRRRDDLTRLRNDDQHNIRLKEDLPFHRERGDRQREREEWHRLKQPNEEMSSRKEKGEMSSVLMRGRVTEDKTWASQSKGKDEHRSMEKDYYSKETGRQELLKKRDQVDLPQNSGREDPHARGTQVSNNERRARHERASARDDRASNTSADSRIHEKKQKQNPRKGKDSEVIDQNSLSILKKNQDENSGQTSDTVRLKNRAVMGNDENKLVSKRSRDDASSGDEQSEAKRGRSKLERWTSHKERDFSVGVKPTSSMKSKQIDAHVAAVPSATNKHPAELSKTVEDEHHPPGNEKDDTGLEIDVNPFQDKHLDTVEKLKKRSERFKLPMPGERETITTTVNKMETEQIPPTTQSENHADSEVKAERPTRKRRWTGN